LLDFCHNNFMKLKSMVKFFSLFFLLSNLIYSQKLSDSTYVKFTNQKMVIDGIDNESSWKKADLKTGFWQWFPTDTLKAGKQTEIKFLFDNENIYAFVKCYEDKDKAVISSLRRDMGRYSDFFLFTFDSFLTSEFLIVPAVTRSVAFTVIPIISYIKRL